MFDPRERLTAAHPVPGFDPVAVMSGGISFDPEHRPDWYTWGLLIAAGIATRGDCRRRRIGAVIVDPRWKIIGTGYNGVAPHTRGCIEGACPRAFSDVAHDSSYSFGAGTCIAAHAEQNAITDAGAERLAVLCTIFISQPPCPGCCNLINRYRLTCVYAAPAE